MALACGEALALIAFILISFLFALIVLRILFLLLLL